MSSTLSLATADPTLEIACAAVADRPNSPPGIDESQLGEAASPTWPDEAEFLVEWDLAKETGDSAYRHSALSDPPRTRPPIGTAEKAAHLRSLINRTGNLARSARAGGSLLNRMGTAMKQLSRGDGVSPETQSLIEEIRRARAEIPHEPAAMLPNRFSHNGDGWTGGTGSAEADGKLRRVDARTAEHLQVIAHEFRNPLATIRLGLSILSQSKSPDQQARTLAMLDRQIDLLARLTDDLAAGSRITHEEVDLRTERIDVRAAMAIAMQSGRRLVDALGHLLTVHLPDEPLVVEIDVDRFNQIVTNLLGNAAKYTDRGGWIEVCVSRDGDDVLIEIRDSGVGLPADMLDAVFEPFVRGRSSPGRVRDGHGIGLAVVRRLVEAHGGAVWAESDGPGCGSTFTVRLPLAKGDG